MQSTIFEISFFGISIAPKWYGLMYALGFLISYQFVKKWGKLSLRELDNLLLAVFFWVLFWGRIGYILFYNLSYYLSNPYDIFKVWEGGMSFHGWLLWVIIAVYIFSKYHQKNFFAITDTLAIIVPVAIGFGRIGNYINQELPWYTPYTGPFAIVKNGVSYFPSPLLEMLLEGILLFIILISTGYLSWFFKEKNQKKYREGRLSALFLIGYGLLRMIAEQFRLPDTHIWYLFHTEWFTLGMLYTIPILVWGILIFWYKERKY
jgi:phosphatidylglycerol---prolipoprotein diacylglyceryl transferase